MLLLLIDCRGARHPKLPPIALPSRGEHSTVPGKKDFRHASVLTGRVALSRIDLSVLTHMQKADPCNLLNSSVYVLCSPRVLLEMAPSP